MQEVACRVPRADAWNVATGLFQIISDLRFIKLRRHPEVGEEQDHQRLHGQIPKRTVSQRIAQTDEEITHVTFPKLPTHCSKNLGRKH